MVPDGVEDALRPVLRSKVREALYKRALSEGLVVPVRRVIVGIVVLSRRVRREGGGGRIKSRIYG